MVTIFSLSPFPTPPFKRCLALPEHCAISQIRCCFHRRWGPFTLGLERTGLDWNLAWSILRVPLRVGTLNGLEGSHSVLGCHHLSMTQRG